MTYVALLRGINVGGNNKIEMAKLKLMFESLGFSNVSTYIASGNVVFTTNQKDEDSISKEIESSIKKDFDINIRVLLKSEKEIKKIVEKIPKEWVNDSEMKCDVMFLWKESDSKKIVKDLVVNIDIEDLVYVPGALLWRIDKKDAGKSKVLKIIGTKLYKSMTVRNVNTVRVLGELMKEITN